MIICINVSYTSVAREILNNELKKLIKFLSCGCSAKTCTGTDYYFIHSFISVVAITGNYSNQ